MSIFAESSDDGIRGRVNSIAQGPAFDTIAAAVMFCKDRIKFKYAQNNENLLCINFFSLNK